jgi:hypothetical protein
VLDLGELTIAARPGQMQGVADAVVAAAQAVGGTGTKELPDPDRIAVLVDVPGSRESEFRTKMADMGGPKAPANSPNEPTSPSPDRKSFVIHVVEHSAP